jgi:choline dehydrogenase-like flavoprotein
MHGGKKFVINAAREVILSAGVVQTPQILELSGIGNPQILSQAGIDCMVNNPSVGENFQDHVLGGMIFECAPGVLSLDALHGDEYGQKQQMIYEKEKTGPFGSPGMLMGFISYASLVSEEELNATIAAIKKNSLATTPFQKDQEQLIINQLSDPKFANLQTFLIPANMDMTAGGDQTKFLGPPPKGKNRVAPLICLEHPLSRGSIHIRSSDPTKAPRIDPGYFRNGADAKILAAGLKWLDQVTKTPILKKSLGERVQPAPEVSLETEEDRIAVLRDHISTQYHLIGTASMGEVVDERLLVKGVKGLRVIDASICPSHVSGNIMSTIYAVAEKGADLVKEDRCT